MGLDMYLNAKRFLWHNEEALSEDIAHHFPELKGKRVKEIVVEALYWRKANAIHAWFVKHCQEGVDDCGNYWVAREQLQELRDLIVAAIDEKDASKLPPQAGFFFGSTDITDWYWDDLKRTQEGLERILVEFPENWEFEYHSSW